MKLKLLHQNVKELNASSSNASPHPGKVHILHPQRTAYSQMPLGFLGWEGDVEASKMCLIQLMFYSMILIP